MRRVSSSCSPPSLKPYTAAALSEAPASNPTASSVATSARRTFETSSTPRALWSNTRIGVASGVAVETETDSAPAPVSASINGCTSVRAVAATVTTMRSAPAVVGAVQPNAASLALHGVRRSICARTTPSRNSVARCGSSSGRNRKREAFSSSSA